MQKLGFSKVATAYNGREGFEMFQKEHFDIVIMDCQMPEMDGYDATQAIRSFEKEYKRAPTPVIAITADAIKGAKDKCLSVGMDDYLTKPIEQVKLEKVLGQYLDVSLPQAKSAVNDMPLPAVSNANTTPLNLEHLEVFTDGDKQEEEKLLNLFFEQTDLSLSDLRQALQEENTENWGKAAHRLKGAAANLGAETLAATCKQAEEAKGDTKDVKENLLRKIIAQEELLRKFSNERLCA